MTAALPLDFNQYAPIQKGDLFKIRHACGVTEYIVGERHEREPGYYLCSQHRCVEGTHGFDKGAHRVFHRTKINELKYTNGEGFT